MVLKHYITGKRVEKVSLTMILEIVVTTIAVCPSSTESSYAIRVYNVEQF